MLTYTGTLAFIAPEIFNYGDYKKIIKFFLFYKNVYILIIIIDLKYKKKKFQNFFFSRFYNSFFLKLKKNIYFSSINLYGIS